VEGSLASGPGAVEGRSPHASNAGFMLMAPSRTASCVPASTSDPPSQLQPHRTVGKTERERAQLWHATLNCKILSGPESTAPQSPSSAFPMDPN
jgi:hypothetical protein